MSYQPVKFGFQNACLIGDKTFLIRHVTTHGHVIKELCHFVGGGSLLQAITLSRGRGRAGPPITVIPFVNLPNSRLPNQQNEKRRHRQNCSMKITREETNNSSSYKFFKS